MTTHSITFGLLNQVQLRNLCPTDIPAVKKLCAEWFPIDYPDSWFEAITSNTKFYSLAAIFDTRIIGIIVSEVKRRFKCNREDADILASSFPLSTEVAYILSLGVVETFRRCGIASLLLNSLLSYLLSAEQHNCKAIYLHVLTTNVSAIRFYERQNFKQHSFLPYYYSIHAAPHDAYCYVLYMNGGQPPWTFTDYMKHIGDSLARLQPCLLPQRLMLTAQKVWRRVITGTIAPKPPPVHHS